ncbi:MAG: MGMT family protein, partial [Holosporaceae bacterium]|nr:MGMT family protein [Holosporaceae bacterium]
MEKMNCFQYETTIGKIVICANTRGVTNFFWGELSNVEMENTETEIIKRAFVQLGEYLSGLRKNFDIKLEYSGTDFQLAVWDQLKKISYGKTKTYKEIA